jgi:hypothetical protein
VAAAAKSAAAGKTKGDEHTAPEDGFRIMDFEKKETKKVQRSAPPGVGWGGSRSEGGLRNNTHLLVPMQDNESENAQVPVQLILTLGLDFSMAGTQFTCFTGTKVQIMTRLEHGRK